MKDRATGKGAEIAADVVEKNYEDEEFVDAIENYHEEAREERDEGNAEDIAALTCNTSANTSKRS